MRELQKIFWRDHNPASIWKFFHKGGQTLGGFFAAGFDFDRVELAVGFEDKIDLGLLLSPVKKLAWELNQLGTNRQFKNPAAPLGIVFVHFPRSHRVKRRAGREHLGGRASCQPLLGGVFLQGIEQKRAAIQFDVIFHQVRIAAILQLTKQFGEADLLRRIVAENFKGLPKECGICHPPVLEDILADHRLHDGLLHVGIPTLQILLEAHGSRVAAKR